MASSSANAISLRPNKYQVFLSFRGTDTRNGFLGHLYKALTGKGIRTYIDESSLERGSEIAYSLVEAIQESEASVVVLSENYGGSWWCLDELVQIIQSRERNGLIVVPVFYRVEPTHVRKQVGKFGDAFSELKERFKDNEEKLNSWTTALSTVADLSGWDSSVIRSEAELLDEIVKDVKRKLERKSRPSKDTNGLVGIGERVEKIKSLLCISNQDRLAIGIWGMGGLGKTTLAMEVFYELCCEFECCCFVDDVRENWEKGKKEELRNKLHSKLLGEENPYNAQERLSVKKVLVVLDDVNDEEQFKFLLRDGFGDGSRVIVTTRDKQMLRWLDAEDFLYEVKGLNQHESLELFLMNAFRNKSHSDLDTELSDRVLSYAQGVPLAIEVLGSYLRRKRKDNWAGEMEKLERSPNDKIQNVLKISYDGLDEKNKKIFLDVACFFKGGNRKDVESILDGCGFCAKVGIDDLIDKSLLTISDNQLWMHDLIQEMGRKIVNSTEKREERSRLWNAEDVVHVLKNDIGSEAIEGIFLDTSKIGEMDLSPVVFKPMHNLRLLKIKDANGQKLNFRQGLQSLPDELRYLSWYKYPLKYLPSSFSLHNLVELDMPNCQLEKLWHGVQNLGNLKLLNLSFSENLTQIPDLSCAPRLWSVNLRNCKNLLEVPRLSFQNVDSYVSDNELSRGYTRTARKPGTLILNGCRSLKSLPNASENMKYLHSRYTSVEELDTSICSLNNLIILDLNHCNLKKLPRDISKLESLRYLSLCFSPSFNTFPKELPRNIVELNLSWTEIEQVPSSIEHVSSLKILNLSNCERLKNLPTSICKLKCLLRVYLFRCLKLEKFPEILEPMESFTDLYLQESGITELPFSFCNLVGLQYLFMDGCESLRFVPDSIYSLSSLKQLFLSNCSLLDSLPLRLSGLCLLTELNLAHCSIHRIPDWIGCLSMLEILDLGENLFESLPSSVKQLSVLNELRIRNCKNLLSLPALPSSLLFLDATGCVSLQTVPSSREALLQYRHERESGHHMDFRFCHCSELNQNSRDNIAAESYLRILLMAAYSMLSDRFDEKPSVSVCSPGNELPEWLNSFQSTESQMKITLPLDWHSESFIGLAFGAVVAFQDFRFNGESVEPLCKFHFKNNDGVSIRGEFLCNFPRPWVFESRSEIEISNLDHWFVWHSHNNYRDCRDATALSLEFSLKELDREEFIVRSGYKLRSCGVRLLYLSDAKELGIDFDRHLYGKDDDDEEDDDGEVGQSENGTDDTDGVEPPSKKAKLSDV